MSYAPKDIRYYDEAIERGAHWIVSHQTEDGSHGPDATEVMAYYTCPLALQAAGKPKEALACLEYIKKTFLRPDGALIVPEWMAGMTAYPASWLARGAHQWGRIDLSHRLIEFILKFQDANTGGFFGTTEEAKAGKGRIEYYTSGVATMACLWTGRLEEALRGGDYLLALDRLQPERDRRYYFVTDSDGKLVTEPGDAQPETLFQQRGKPLQHYDKSGLYAAVMVYLHRVRPRKEYLDAAVRCVEFALNCAEDVFETRHSHKLCWGAAELFQETGEPRFREASLRIADFLIGCQEPDGRWHYKEEFERLEDQPLSIHFDMTAQQVCWIAKAREVWGKTGS